MAKASGRLFDRVSKDVGHEAAQRWWALSEEAHRAAVLGADPAEVVRKLNQAATAEPDSPLSPAFRLWAADALCRVSHHQEALAAYDRVITAAERAQPFGHINFARQALWNRAGAHIRLGNIDAALESYRELARRGEIDALYEAGAVFERAGRFDQATALYREVAQSAPEDEALADRASRAAERLTSSGGVFTPSELGIAKLVEDAVTSRDADALRRLSSRTHLQAGPGAGHMQFENEEIIGWLCADLITSYPHRMHPGLLGVGDKRYLLTTGWRGKRFEYVVGFYFVRSGRGWGWEGIIVNSPVEPWLKRWAPNEMRTNQPLTLPLLAPWPAGRYFMAGGLSDFIWQSAFIAGLAAIPIIGGGLAAAQAYAYSLSHCGFGLRGFYYNAGPTHTGDDAFAIDFSSYRRGVPFLNASGGTPVLSPADGIVRWAKAYYPSGSDWNGGTNEVQIDHDDPFTGASRRFVTRYLHLAGPDMVLVSTGMVAYVGRRLGYMDDTGTSVINHLHFSIHDSSAGPGIGPSVRPSPMDGYVLGEGNSGACIRSTNRETFYDPAHVVDRSAEFGTPPAAGPPTACVIPGLGVQNIAYRDSSRRLHELWRDAQGNTGTTNLTANAGAPQATGNPFAYVDTIRNTEILLYRGVDGTVRSLYWSTGPVGHDDLSSTAGAPKAAGNPLGYYTATTDGHHVVYRTSDGHLHLLNWIGVAPVAYGGNLTAAISAPRARGDPTVLVNTAGVNMIIYRSVNDHILSLYWSFGGSSLDNLSGYAGTPPAAGDPLAYYTAYDDTHQVVYRAGDGHLYELYWPGVTPVMGWDLTAGAGAPTALGDPAAYYSAGTNTKHVIYSSSDGRLHELWWVPGGSPSHVDLTLYGTPKAAIERPAAFTVEGPNTQHVAYRGTNNHIYEVFW
jgi:murein DD-endopeptidase MepM/ murein hydrolase activator NlpD